MRWSSLRAIFIQYFLALELLGDRGLVNTGSSQYDGEIFGAIGAGGDVKKVKRGRVAVAATTTAATAAATRAAHCIGFLSRDTTCAAVPVRVERASVMAQAVVLRLRAV